jgi:hypothetical protein
MFNDFCYAPFIMESKVEVLLILEKELVNEYQKNCYGHPIQQL